MIPGIQVRCRRQDTEKVSHPQPYFWIFIREDRAVAFAVEHH